VDFLDKHWGDLASAIGLAVTLYAAAMAKRAATVAQEVKERLSRFEAIEVMSSAIAAMDEIKGLHRIGAWELALSRYSGLRKNLAIAETAMTIEQRGRIGGALQQFRIIEEAVDRAVASRKTTDLDVARFNEIMSGLMDELPKIMIATKRTGA
jgi:hypothetical protein